MTIPKLIYYSDNSYITNQGTLLEDFETFSDWTIGGGTGSADSIYKKQGMYSLKLNSVNGVDINATKTINENLSSVNHFLLWIYVHDSMDGHVLDKLDYCIIRFSSVTDWSKYFSAVLDGENFKPGWNRIAITKARFSTVGEESWSNTMIRLRVWCKANTGEDVAVNFDDLRYDHVAKAKCILTFDDCCQGQHDLAKPIMDANGQAGVTFCPTSWVDTAGDHLTKAQLIALQNAGWDISNHCEEHLHLPDVSQETMEETIDNGHNWLVDNGFDKGARFFAPPYGEYNQAIVIKIKERHTIARSTIRDKFQAHFNLKDDDQEFFVKQVTVDASHTPTTICDWIDDAIIRKGLVVLAFHHIIESGASGNQYNVADFETVSDYLKTKQDAGDIDVITFSDYYNQFISDKVEFKALLSDERKDISFQNVGQSEDFEWIVYSHSVATDPIRYNLILKMREGWATDHRWIDLRNFIRDTINFSEKTFYYVDVKGFELKVKFVPNSLSHHLIPGTADLFLIKLIIERIP